jgi:acetyltransferase
MNREREGLNGLLRPRSIAIIGASNTPGKIGYLAAKNVIESDYEGQVYPINWNVDRHSGEILGVRAYRSVLDVPGEIDAAMIIVPAETTPAVVEECGQKGVKGLIIVASGYSEAGRKDLEDRVVAIARGYGMRVLGPNIVGIMSNSDKCNASFAPFLPLPGRASMLSQSGALLIAMTVATYSRHVGFDKMIPTGNMADVNFSDLVAWLNEDEKTACITMYIEGLHDGRRFIETARCARKPIVALKAGISAHGAAAAASHTGSMAGSGRIYEAAFKQAGVVRAADLNNLFDRTLALSLQPPMRGDNLLVLSNGGGVGVLAADAAERYGVPLQFAPDDVQEALRAYMPPFGSAKNPVDLTGMVGWREYEETVTYALGHPWVDGLVVLYCETQRTEPMKIAESIKRAVERRSGDLAQQRSVPIAVSFIGGERSDVAMKWLAEHGIPAYGAPDLAVNAMAALREYARACQDVRQAEGVEHAPEHANYGWHAMPHYDDVDQAGARAILTKVRAEGRNPTEIEAKRVFAAYGLPVATTKLARSEEEAVEIAEAMGYPLVMKIISPDILHKSDAGGVKINVRGVEAVREAYREILENARAYADAEGIGRETSPNSEAGGIGRETSPNSEAGGIGQETSPNSEAGGIGRETSPNSEAGGIGRETSPNSEAGGIGRETSPNSEAGGIGRETSPNSEAGGIGQETSPNSEAGGIGQETSPNSEARGIGRETSPNSEAGGIGRETSPNSEAGGISQETSPNSEAGVDIHGVAVQEMAPWGTEVILGSVNDPTFGPTLMFGLGGVFVEVLRDVTFRVAPISKAHAMKMLSEIDGAPILEGVRGESPRDREALAEALSRYAQMITELGDVISESDANPVLVYTTGQGLKVVDARIVLRSEGH